MKINLKKYQQLFFLGLVIAILIGLNYGLNYLNLQNARQNRQKLRQTQIQIIQDFWEKQNLSDQEIQQKLKKMNRDRTKNLTPEQIQKFKQRMQQNGDNKNVRNIMRMAH